MKTELRVTEMKVVLPAKNFELLKHLHFRNVARSYFDHLETRFIPWIRKAEEVERWR